VRGRYGYQPELPASPGIEGVGIVEAVGPGVQATTVGTCVVFVDTWNTWRQQIVCPVDKLLPVPDGLDDAAATTSYINPLTAWALTRSEHNLQEGDWLLQTAAASSVGRLVLQLAQHHRFKTINVIRRREQESIIRNLGGNEVICTADEDLRARLQELTGGKGVERAIDCVAGELGAEIARNLAPGGTMLVYGALSSHRQTDPAMFTMPLFAPRLIYSTATVRGWWLPRWVPSQPLAAVRAATSDLLAMLSNGALTPPATVRYPLKDFQEAIRLADGEAGQEKVLLDFSGRER
jgi:NADPH2:quinone reductase